MCTGTPPAWDQRPPDLPGLRLAEFPHVNHMPLRFDDQGPEAEGTDGVLHDPVLGQEDLAAR